ncbi:MAG: aminotransferase class V-fold PLP-dependent enzyme [Desulfovibrionaceae bacterium]|nr:aminotransferase class V-fold PLP-dependent enzyme [Desulfovibrionaceae bacterium]
MKYVYLDNNATTQLAPEVLEVMLPYLGEEYGNPSGRYALGVQARRAVAHAREQVAGLLGAEPDEIVFTSGGTESDNAAIYSALQNRPQGRLVATRVEHSAVLSNVLEHERRGGAVSWLEVDGAGRMNPDDAAREFSPDTALISIMYANNETGTIFPIRRLAELAAERGIHLLCDAVQAVGKVAIDLKEIPLTYLALSGHKLHGPKGVGALYVRRKTPFAPFLMGGGQENGRRSGTENVPGIVGLGKACELAHLQFHDMDRLARLRDRLERGILELAPDTLINGDVENRLPGTCNVAFRQIKSDELLLLLNRVGIMAGAGSACSSGSHEASHVLRAMGVPDSHIYGAVRFSLSRYNDESDVDCVLRELPPVLKQLRRGAQSGVSF